LGRLGASCQGSGVTGLAQAKVRQDVFVNYSLCSRPFATANAPPPTTLTAAHQLPKRSPYQPLSTTNAAHHQPTRLKHAYPRPPLADGAG